MSFSNTTYKDVFQASPHESSLFHTEMVVAESCERTLTRFMWKGLYTQGQIP